MDGGGDRDDGLSCGAILRMVWPLALGMANNAVMQFVDRVFLSRESALSLEAALPASMLALLFVGFFQSVVAYSGTFAAQYHGKGDDAGCARSCTAGLLLALAGGAVCAALVPAGRALLDLGGHSAAVLAREKTYYSVVMGGGAASCALMAVQGYFTGISRTRVVFWANVAGNAANVALDALLIFGCGRIPAMGIAGAAYATVAAQALQFAVLFALAWPALARARRAPFGEARTLPWRILRYGVPSGVYSLLNILSFTVFVFLTGRVGDTAFAASNAAFSVNYLLIAPIEGFALGAGALVGQRQGAGDAAGAARAGARVLALAEAYVLAASVAVLVFHRPILGLFVADAAAADAAAFLSLGFTLFLMMAAWQLFDGADVVLSGALKGAGDTKFVMNWMLVCSFGFWLPLLFCVYRLHPTMPALWATQIVYVAVICIGTALRWFFGPWRRIRLV